MFSDPDRRVIMVAEKTGKVEEEGMSEEKDGCGDTEMTSEAKAAQPRVEEQHPLFKKISEGDLEGVQNFLEVRTTYLPTVSCFIFF